MMPKIQISIINCKIKSILSGLVTRKLYLKKKRTLNRHFPRPAETDPYDDDENDDGGDVLCYNLILQIM